MNTPYNRVDFFREAAPYIFNHRNKTFVIAIKSELITHERFYSLMKDIAILSALGVRLVLVHGARIQIDERLSEKQHGNAFHNDLRITDPKTMRFVQEVVGAIRLKFENAFLHALNTPPVINEGLGLISGNLITAKPLGVHEGVDFQHTGEVRKINVSLIQNLVAQGQLVLLSPVGFSPTGEAYNLGYENVAIHAAQALHADKLIFIESEAPDLPDFINLTSIQQATKDNPKYAALLNNVQTALQEGVERIHLINASDADSLLLELYTRDGAGHMFSTSLYENIRQATINDVTSILELIQPLEEKGMLVKRSREQLELEISNFTILERDNTIIACAARYDITHDTSEFACLAVHPDYRRQNRGDTLLDAISKQSAQKGIKQLVVLTTHTTDWFRERGFQLSDANALPEARKAQYNFQRNSKVLLKYLH